jgi:glutaredoxin 3
MQLDLYHLNACPYSAKVRDYLSGNGLAQYVTYHEVEEEAGALRRLEAMNGSRQVPCLVVNGHPMLESDRIIAFCEENVRPYFEVKAS